MDSASGSRDGVPGGIRDLADLGEITPDVLRKTFASRRIFCHLGAWWAIRSGCMKEYGAESLHRCMLAAPGLITLADKLCLREWLDSLNPDDLASVYRDMTLPEMTG